MDFPPVTIVMTTYFPEGKAGIARMLAARSAVKSWKKHLQYVEEINLAVIDDGSPEEYTDRFQERILEIFPDPDILNLPRGGGVGRSLNFGFASAFILDNIVLYAVDDWALTKPLNITPWVKLLLERVDVGMVRLGPPHPNTSGRIEMFTDDWQGWGLRLDRYAYAYGQRPALYHERFTDHYGWFKEGVSAIDCEREYAENFVRLSGPDIVLALPHPWQHIDTVSMSDMTPGG